MKVPVIHFRRPLGRVLCGRRPAAGPGGHNHVAARSTCIRCLRLLGRKR